jgi:hypothetical protein
MTRKQYVLYEPGGNVARGFAYGKLVEVRYVDVIPTGIESPDREEFIALVKAQELSDEDLRECRIGYVDDKGVGEYCSWQEFLDLATEAG